MGLLFSTRFSKEYGYLFARESASQSFWDEFILLWDMGLDYKTDDTSARIRMT